jgi:hypothetical protein
MRDLNPIVGVSLNNVSDIGKIVLIAAEQLLSLSVSVLAVAQYA